MSTGVRRRLSTLGAAATLSAAMVLGLAGPASAEPAVQSQPALVAPAVAPAAFVVTDPTWNRRCHRYFHRSWSWGGWDRHHHWHRYGRPGWWSCR